ncbi:type II toxin-antitoxin system ParD family antitoxin [uncultured Maricaulis sp.]|uniref:type II toxin-antitoxin system ParD family antitoxin n=1 Tax=uncultured Maricaulis sp. TaxID=174710 RepID=UPI0030D8ED23|tara:strand:+ start:50505 stop:50747 length:243 start_codon:yes stop_codon:yes gene_type:complete
MGKNTSFAVSEYFADFIQRQVAEGRYSSASDVVRAGLRLLELEDRRHRALKQAIDQGLASGTAEPFDLDDFLAEQHASLR